MAERSPPNLLAECSRANAVFRSTLPQYLFFGNTIIPIRLLNDALFVFSCILVYLLAAEVVWKTDRCAISFLFWIFDECCYS